MNPTTGFPHHSPRGRDRVPNDTYRLPGTASNHPAGAVRLQPGGHPPHLLGGAQRADAEQPEILRRHRGTLRLEAGRGCRLQPGGNRLPRPPGRRRQRSPGRFRPPAVPGPGLPDSSSGRGARGYHAVRRRRRHLRSLDGHRRRTADADSHHISPRRSGVLFLLPAGRRNRRRHPVRRFSHGSGSFPRHAPGCAGAPEGAGAG